MDGYSAEELREHAKRVRAILRAEVDIRSRLMAQRPWELEKWMKKRAEAGQALASLDHLLGYIASTEPENKYHRQERLIE